MAWNGEKVLPLLLGGDKDIVIRCGGVAFNVVDGRGKSTLIVIDTEQTQVLGTARFDLANERFDLNHDAQTQGGSACSRCARRARLRKLQEARLQSSRARCSRAWVARSRWRRQPARRPVPLIEPDPAKKRTAQRAAHRRGRRKGSRRTRPPMPPNQRGRREPKHLYELCRKAVMAWIDDMRPAWAPPSPTTPSSRSRRCW